MSNADASKPAPARRAGLKTFSHLKGARRVPSEYELGSTQLLYYPERGGFAVQTPLSSWYQRYQVGSPLSCPDWEAFRDPRETTYARYTALMSQREAFVEQLFAGMEAGGYDERLTPAALELHERLLAPLRYPIHGLQMAAAYVGQMAPSGRIVIACALQAADEMRRIQHLAYRLGLLSRRDAGLGERSRAHWQTDPSWQPLRRVVEELLVTWDWGEALVALCLAVKPLVDELVRVELAARALALGDYLTSQLLGACDEDIAWHRAWSRSLIATALAQRPENREPLRAWASAWCERALDALVPLAAAAGAVPDRLRALAREAIP